VGDYIQYIMVWALETCSSGLCEKFNINHLRATLYHCTQYREQCERDTLSFTTRYNQIK
jgi:hypothetical protein